MLTNVERRPVYLVMLFINVFNCMMYLIMLRKRPVLSLTISLYLRDTDNDSFIIK